jgi:hypothetical protein
MWFRFLLQPAVAIALGIRDGLKDAKAGRAPFIWDLILRAEGRKRQIRRSFKTLIKPIVVAIVFDGVAQYLMLNTIYLGAAIIVGTAVMALPYFLARSIMNRVVSLRRGSGWNEERQTLETVPKKPQTKGGETTRKNMM